jgi:uncharacterized membrane protein
MGTPLETTVYQWLRLLNIQVSKSYLEEKLGTHPEYNSLLSITDTVNELGINCQAVVIDQSAIQEVEGPVLVVVKSKGSKFLLVENLLKYSQNNPSFLEVWNGIIVVAEKDAQWKNDENEQRRKQEKGTTNKMLFFFACMLLLPLPALIQYSSFIELPLFVTTLAGISLMFLIIQKELGYSNDFTNRLCSVGKQTDCDAVINSQGAAILKWIDWADLGVIYFSAIWLLQIVSLFTNNLHYSLEIIFITTAASLPLTLLSIYYQWQKVKKWCVLCLFTSLLLWIQFALLLPVSFSVKLTTIPVNILYITAFLFLFTAGVWLLLIKPLLEQRKDRKEKVWPLLRLKRNPEVFLSLLTKERQVDTTPLKHDLRLGNQAARLQIMVACNTYCAPCARAHKALHELLQAHGNNIGITVRFVVHAADESNKKTKAVRHILETWLEKNEWERTPAFAGELLMDWFNGMDLEKFKAKYQTTGHSNAIDLMTAYDNWAKKAEIVHTPTLFINGYELPRLYSVTDVSDIIPSLTEHITAASVDAYTVNQGDAHVRVTGFVPTFKIEANLNFNK